MVKTSMDIIHLKLAKLLHDGWCGTTNVQRHWNGADSLLQSGKSRPNGYIILSTYQHNFSYKYQIQQNWIKKTYKEVSIKGDFSVIWYFLLIRYLYHLTVQRLAALCPHVPAPTSNSI